MRWLAAFLIFVGAVPWSVAAGPLDDFREAAIAAEARAIAAERAVGCSPELAQSVDFADLAVNSAVYNGRCVTVRGLSWGFFLFDSPDNVYLADRYDVLHEGRRIRTANPFRIGIQSHDFDIPDIGTAFYPTEVTGIAVDCAVDLDRGHRVEAIRSMTSDTQYISIRDDFCGWYINSVSINPVAINFGDRRTAQRRTADRERFGSLWPITASASFVEQLSESSLRFLDRMRHGDRSLIEEFDTGYGWVGQLYGVWYSRALASLRSGNEDPQMMHFWEVPPSQNADEISVDAEFRAWTCFCDERDCSEKWPMSETDALPTLGQPYLCIIHYISNDRTDGLTIEDWIPRTAFRGNASPFRDDPLSTN